MQGLSKSISNIVKQKYIELKDYTYVKDIKLIKVEDI